MNFTTAVKIFTSEKSGNIAVTFAIAIIPILMSIGAAVDYTRAINLRSKVSQATDAALLAATAAVMDEVNLNNTNAVNARLDAEFEPFFLANMSTAKSYQYSGYQLSYNPVTKRVTADVDIDYETTILKIFGFNTWQADVVAATSMKMKIGAAISMFLVLDRSSSMSWDNGEGGTKLDSLKVAIDGMISDLLVADPGNQFLRMGAVSYTSYSWPLQTLDWDLNSTNTYVQNMYFDNGTDSSDAVDDAYDELVKPVELTEHQNRNGQVPDLVMVFMTDGDNNDSSDDVATLNTCSRAKSYGVKVYTIAFQAPTNGQQLLSDCASAGSYYYYQPETTAELIAAFKNIGANVAKNLVLSQ